jgi:hypothetical protein
MFIAGPKWKWRKITENSLQKSRERRWNIFSQWERDQKVYDVMPVTLHDKRRSYSTVNTWGAMFRTGIWALKTKNILGDLLKG